MTTEVTEVVVRGVAYYVPSDILRVAITTFDQHYRKGCDVRELAGQVAASLMPASREDPWSEERLRRCILSIKGRKGNAEARKRRKAKQQAEKQEAAQLELWT